MSKILNKSSADNRAYTKAAAKLSAALQLRGYAAYWVGGAVRDMFLGRNIDDIDIATSARPAQIKKVVAELGMKFITIGEKFGTIAVIFKNKTAQNKITQNKTIQITSFRSERGYSDSRHPDKVKFLDVKNIIADASRRDFTVNALYYNPKTKNILDYFGGGKDLKAKRLKFIGSAAARIKEDPLRMMRAARFANTLGFSIGKKDAEAIRKKAKRITSVSGERIKSELDKIVFSANASAGISLLDNLGLLKIILPEFERLKQVKQSSDYHAEGNVFIHSLRAFSHAADVRKKMPHKNSFKTPHKNSLFFNSEELAFCYAVLFHDLGKYGTAHPVIRAGRKHISFHGHGSNSAKIFKGISQRLRFSAADSKRISYLIQHHMDLRHAAEIKGKAMVSFIQNPHTEDLLRLRFADYGGAIRTDAKGKIIKTDLSELRAFARRFYAYKKRAAKPFIKGDDVKSICGLRQGQVIGRILKQMLFYQAAGRVKNRREAISELKKLKLS